MEEPKQIQQAKKGLKDKDITHFLSEEERMTKSQWEKKMLLFERLTPAQRMADEATGRLCREIEYDPLPYREGRTHRGTTPPSNTGPTKKSISDRIKSILRGD